MARTDELTQFTGGQNGCWFKSFHEDNAKDALTQVI